MFNVQFNSVHIASQTYPYFEKKSRVKNWPNLCKNSPISNSLPRGRFSLFLVHESLMNLKTKPQSVTVTGPLQLSKNNAKQWKIAEHEEPGGFGVKKTKNKNKVCNRICLVSRYWNAKCF